MYYVYILHSKKEQKFYYGYTDNLRRRIREHKTIKKSYKLVYYEGHLIKKDALERERYFKSGWGRRYVKKILKNYLKINR